MPPIAEWCEGRDAVAESWLLPEARPTGLRYLPARANGQLALGTYRLTDDGRRYRAIALDVLTLDGSSIAEVIAFRTPAIFPAFGLAREIAA